MSLEFNSMNNYGPEIPKYPGAARHQQRLAEAPIRVMVGTFMEYFTQALQKSPFVDWTVRSTYRAPEKSMLSQVVAYHAQTWHAEVHSNRFRELLIMRVDQGMSLTIEQPRLPRNSRAQLEAVDPERGVQTDNHEAAKLASLGILMIQSGQVLHDRIRDQLFQPRTLTPEQRKLYPPPPAY